MQERRAQQPASRRAPRPTHRPAAYDVFRRDLVGGAALHLDTLREQHDFEFTVPPTDSACRRSVRRPARPARRHAAVRAQAARRRRRIANAGILREAARDTLAVARAAAAGCCCSSSRCRGRVRHRQGTLRRPDRHRRRRHSFPVSPMSPIDPMSPMSPRSPMSPMSPMSPSMHRLRRQVRRSRRTTSPTRSPTADQPESGIAPCP